MENERPKDFCEDSIDQNVKTLFEYTKSLLDNRRKDVETINGKLTTFLAFAGAVLGFTFSLQGKLPIDSLTWVSSPYWICYLSKGSAALLSIYSIILCGLGLLGSNGSGEGMKPEFFKQNCLELRKRKADFQIINSWIDLTIPDLEKTIAKKQKYLRSTIEVLIAVAVCFGLNLVANLISQ